MKDARNLPLDALEQAAKALLAAVQQMRGLSCPQVISAAALHTSNTPANVTELCNEFMLAKARAGRSDGYLALLVKQCRAFCEGTDKLGALALGDLQASVIESWLYGQEWSDKTRHGHLLTLRTVFGFAVARGYLPTNPALAVDLPILTPSERGVHSPDQVRAVLEACADPSTQRYLAIRYFAGLRGSEASALSESEIRDKFILVSAAKAKTRARRLVTIQPNLAAWLAVTGERGGALPLRQVNNRLALAVKSSGVVWPDNVTRHSFCSYHLARFRDAAGTALEAGHSQEMLFRNYRELMTLDSQFVTPELATEFWGIKP